MAEAVGFEPTCPCGQLHFECSSLQPLRYASVYKYSLLGTNHMISSQPRYDHFDTSPYMLTRFHEINAYSVYIRIPLRTHGVPATGECPKPARLKAFRKFYFRLPREISSQPRYDHFDTSPYILTRKTEINASIRLY